MAKTKRSSIKGNANMKSSTNMNSCSGCANCSNCTNRNCTGSNSR